MDKKHFDRTFTSWQREIKFHRITNITLAVAVLVLVFTSMRQETRIIVEPYNLTQAVQITRNSTSSHYAEQFAWVAAQAIGNVTRDNVEFVLEALGPMVSGNIRQRLTNNIENDLVRLHENRVEVTFEPQRILTLPNNQIIVEGTQNRSTMGVEETPQPFHYSFQIETRNYRPVITEIHAVDGRAPRD